MMGAAERARSCEVSDLVKNFPVTAAAGCKSVRSIVQAVSDVSFSVAPAQTLGLVGESGSGKSTVGRCILRLIEPTSGSVTFRGQELTTLGRKPMRALRRRDADRVPGPVRLARSSA